MYGVGIWRVLVGALLAAAVVCTGAATSLGASGGTVFQIAVFSDSSAGTQNEFDNTNATVAVSGTTASPGVAVSNAAGTSFTFTFAA